MLLKNRASSNSGISNPLPQSDFFISEGDRLFGENFATGEYYRRTAENEKKKERYKIRQNQTMERERRRWERIDYEYLRKENQNMVNKEKNLVGRKNNPGMAFNPLNLQYDNSVQGEILSNFITFFFFLVFGLATIILPCGEVLAEKTVSFGNKEITLR